MIALIAACGDDGMALPSDAGIVLPDVMTPPDAPVPDAGTDAGPPDAGPLRCTDFPSGTWSPDYGVGGVLRRNVDPWGRGGGGYVLSVVLTPDGEGVYVGGEFTHAGSVPATNVATFSLDTGWAALADGVSEPVVALAAAADGTLYAATARGETSEGSILRWDGSAWSDFAGYRYSGWGVEEMVVGPDDRLYVAGGFDELGGPTGPSDFGVWDGAVWTDDGTRTDGQVHAILVDEMGLCIGGDFGWVSGVVTQYVACREGGIWRARDLPAMPWMPFDPIVRTLGRDTGGALVAGGRFTMSGGISEISGSVARWDGTRFSMLGGGLERPGGPGVVQVMARGRRGLWMGGDFFRYDRAIALNLGVWNGSSWGFTDLGAQAGGGSFMDAYVHGLAASGDVVWAGGFFDEVVDDEIRAVGGIARFDGVRWQTLADPGARTLGVSGYVGGITAGDGCSVWVAGANAGTQGFLGGVAHLDPREGYTSFAGAFGGSPDIVAVGPDGTLYAAGNFWEDTFDVASRRFEDLARWNGTAWVEVGDLIDWEHGWINALVFDAEGTLFIGGAWNDTTDPGRSNLVEWDGTSWNAVGSGVGTTSNVHALITHPEGGILAAGTRECGSGSGCREWWVSRWDGSSWSELGPGGPGAVFALAWWGSDLIAGGSFIAADGVTDQGVMRWDGSTWTPVGSVAGSVRALEVAGDRLFAGGDLVLVVDGPPVGLVEWDAAASEWHAVAGGLDGDVVGLEAISDALYVTGDFGLAGGIPSSRIAVFGL